MSLLPQPEDGPTETSDNCAEGTLAHIENVYSYMLFLPALSRLGNHRLGMVVGTIILFLTITLQVVLTELAGDFIMNESEEFRDTLIESVSLTGARSTVHGTIHAYTSPKEWLYRILGIVEGDEVRPSNSTGCCAGAFCSRGGDKCCPSRARSRAANGTQGLLSLDRWPRRKEKKQKERPETESSSVGPLRLAVCSHNKDGKLVCSPPVAQFLDAWPELDEDGDGIWTVTEAREDKANLGCRLGVPVDDVFMHACRGITADALDSARVSGMDMHVTTAPDQVRQRLAISLPYFKWWSGLVAICVQIDSARCSQLIKDGAFHAAMSPGNRGLHGGIVDLDTALEYCQRVLRKGGLCDTAMPSTFLMFRDRIGEKCGGRHEEMGDQLTNPHDPSNAMYVLDVSYAKVDEFTTMRQWWFWLFMIGILFILYINLLGELRYAIDLGDFCRNFPTLEETGEESEVPGRDESNNDCEAQTLASRRSKGSMSSIEPPTIKGITRTHRYLCIVILVVRLWLVIYLANVGTAYLLSTHSVVDLLLNSVALCFVFEIPVILYRFIIDSDWKLEVEAIDALRYPSSLPTSSFGKMLYAKHVWGLGIVPIVAFYVVVVHDQHMTAPIHEALRCSCQLTGPKCAETDRFPQEWWDAHWASMAALPWKTAMRVEAGDPTASLLQSPAPVDSKEQSLRFISEHTQPKAFGLMQTASTRSLGIVGEVEEPDNPSSACSALEAVGDK